MHIYSRSNLVLLSFSLSWAWFARADFEPIALTTNSFNQDLVVEKGAPPPAVPVTTASMDEGVSDTGYAWFERGYLPEAPAAGLPEADSILTSNFLADHHYRMPRSYRSRNAVLIDTRRASAQIRFIAPTNYAALSFLTSSGVARNLIRYTANHQDGSSESGTFSSPNWYSDGDPAWAANGRINISLFTHAGLNSDNPRLYSADVELSNHASAVTNIDLSIESGSGHTAIFALSGAISPGDEFVPIDIDGYTEDLVVEASATKPGFLETNTTATMDGGTANALFTWYEKGYDPVDPESGLPAAGSLFTAGSNPDHRFLMPASYVQKNAILLDSVCTNCFLVPLTPACYSLLSFLTAAAHGPVTNFCVITHSSGNSETNSFVSPDWLGTFPPALIAHGRVSVTTKMIDQLEVDAPRLYAADMPVMDTNSPIIRIRLSRIGTDISAHAVVFALAGVPISGSPLTRPCLSITYNQSGTMTIASTRSGRLESCATLSGSGSAWKDEGPISGSITRTPVTGSPARFYRVVAQ